MEATQLDPIFQDSDQAQHPNPDLKDSSMDEDDESLVDSMLCDHGSRLIPTGFTKPNSTSGECVMFVNAGTEALFESDSGVTFLGDSYFVGGNVLRTNEQITDAGDYPYIYQSARVGDCCYRFNYLPPGEYYIDLHFIEIINTNGPKGMRVFNVFIQEEKVLSDFDIFAIAGANKPLQLVDSRVSVKEDGLVVIRFEGVVGSPLVSGIGIRRSPSDSVTGKTVELLKCNKCDAEIEVQVSSAQKKLMQKKSTAKYEKKIQELSTRCELKAKECYEAWMSLTVANEQLDKVRMELDNTAYKTLTQDQAMQKQAEDIRNLSIKYEHDKNYWASAVNDLQLKIKLMQKEHLQLSQSAHACADSIPELNNMISAVQGLVAECEDLKMKYNEEQVKRKKLFNEVQEAKGNIRVFCRCRPLSKEEITAGCKAVVDFEVAQDGCLGFLAGGSTKKSFKFDRVYTPKDDQADVFVDASPMVISVLDGYNVCIFAYGQTGTGKTFTMEGTEKNRGVNYRTLEQLFEIANERRETFTYDISVSVLEVYNEQIRDLLDTSPHPSKKLEIKQTSEGSHHVPGIVEAKVKSIKEVWRVLQAGSNARAVGSNNVNEHSSRSHCLLCIMVKAKNLLNGESTKSKLWLVDLAGSERLAKTDVQGERLKEAQNINRSLSALGDVISALANKSGHIPYRNSKLTHLLQDSLGGDSKTLMFVQISPSDQDLGETMSSLNFATRVRGIELGPVKKQVDTSELQKTKLMLERARQEARSKDDSLRKLEESLQNLESKNKGKDQIYKSQQEKIKDLEGKLELKSALHIQLEKQVSQLSDRLRGKEETCSCLKQKVEQLEADLRQQQKAESESANLRQKVKDLQSKLNEQMQESDFLSTTLQHKVKELEMKLKEEEQKADPSSLHQKIKELEHKLREQEKQFTEDKFSLVQEKQLLEQKLRELEKKLVEDKLRGQENQLQCTRVLTEAVRATPQEGKAHVRDEIMNDVDPCILRTSNSVNRRMSQGSTLLKGTDSLHEKRRKREFRRGETENFHRLSISLYDNKSRKSDPPKIARITRPAKPVTATQGPLIHKRINRDQVQVKERDTKRKIWS
ncbi:kinesin-like protein KIN-14R [Argentina anserina]|uniref:kinesin-like protein KIN-14R n=1 Tax=Argentina anserina TaxID=57926 RepID=UPI0021768829|nr:kinesin-like protein KIN-14R [Potentilla anserina]